jgi:hypothetical protein
MTLYPLSLLPRHSGCLTAAVCLEVLQLLSHLSSSISITPPLPLSWGLVDTVLPLRFRQILPVLVASKAWGKQSWVSILRGSRRQKGGREKEKKRTYSRVQKSGREKRRKGREHGAGPRYLLTSWPLTTRIW